MTSWSAKPATFGLRRPPVAARAAAGNAPTSPVSGTALGPQSCPVLRLLVTCSLPDSRFRSVWVQRSSLSLTRWPASARSCRTPSCSMISRGNSLLALFFCLVAPFYLVGGWVDRGWHIVLSNNRRFAPTAATVSSSLLLGIAGLPDTKFKVRSCRDWNVQPFN